MSVLKAVAFLNGGDQELHTKGGASYPAPPPRSTSAAPAERMNVQQQNNKPATTAAMTELSRIRTGGGAGLTSLLSKFGQEQQASPPNRQQQQQQKPSPIPTPSIPPPTITSKTIQPSNRMPTHPITTPPPRTVPLPSRKMPMQIDLIVQELTAMYQESLEQFEATQQQLKQLQSNTEALEADSTKVRDYEIRVEYLSQKLDQMVEERDGLEQELQQYRVRHGSLDMPVSFEHRLSGMFDKRSIAEVGDDDDDDDDDDEEASNELMNGILDAYDNEDADQGDGNNSERSLSNEEQIVFLTEQLQACDLGAKMAVQQCLTELENERKRARTLQDVVKKQEAIIATLESNSSQQPLSPSSTEQTGHPVFPPPRNASLTSRTSTEHHRLREQIESQRIELEDKRQLLTQLLNEREKHMHKNPSKTNSIDRLAELARVESPLLPAPSQGRIPPIPGTALTSPSKSFGRNSVSSFREEDDNDNDGASSLTSWSAASDKNSQSNGAAAKYADYSSPDVTNEHHLLALRMLTGE